MSVVTTYLQMLTPTELKPVRCDDPRFWIREATVKQGEFNRFLYLLVGGPWSWTDKSNWSAQEWEAYATAPNLRTFGAYYDGSPAGYYELLTAPGTDIEIAYFGLAPKFIGRGFGGALLTHALEEAWKTGTTRVWVHTCNLDSPAALANYKARGMRVYKVEGQ